MKNVKAVIIGGGSAGLSAAITLKENGIDDILVLEKDRQPGGILRQCIHNGFGLQTFHEQLSGPTYAERFIKRAEELHIEILTDCMVLSLNEDRIIEYACPKEGYVKVQAEIVILAVGCYERNRGAVEIAGTRPSGVYTAGQAQRYLNIDGYLVGKRVFILGSGDIGLIMARRMTLEGAKVLGVAEVMPYSGGLPRNIKQCLEDFEIPLYLSHTVTKIEGDDRIKRIEVSQVDENRRPIPKTEMSFDVDTLLLSVGLIPENHLAEEAGIAIDSRTKGPFVDDNYMTNINGIFACGNGLHVHDLVDYVTLEAKRAAMGALRWLKQKDDMSEPIVIETGNGIGYTVPSRIHKDTAVTTEVFFRVRNPYENVEVIVTDGENVLTKRRFRKIIPATMERFTLKQEQMKSLVGPIKAEIKEVQ